MKEFYTRPIPVEAFQWDGKMSTLKANKYNGFEEYTYLPQLDKSLIICASDDDVCYVGDWLVLDSQNQIHVYSNTEFHDKFKANFETE